MFRSLFGGGSGGSRETAAPSDNTAGRRRLSDNTPRTTPMDDLIERLSKFEDAHVVLLQAVQANAEDVSADDDDDEDGGSSEPGGARSAQASTMDQTIAADECREGLDWINNELASFTGDRSQRRALEHARKTLSSVIGQWDHMDSGTPSIASPIMRSRGKRLRMNADWVAIRCDLKVNLTNLARSLEDAAVAAEDCCPTSPTVEANILRGAARAQGYQRWIHDSMQAAAEAGSGDVDSIIPLDMIALRCECETLILRWAKDTGQEQELLGLPFMEARESRPASPVGGLEGCVQSQVIVDSPPRKSLCLRSEGGGGESNNNTLGESNFDNNSASPVITTTAIHQQQSALCQQSPPFSGSGSVAVSTGADTVSDTAVSEPPFSGGGAVSEQLEARLEAAKMEIESLRLQLLDAQKRSAAPASPAAPAAAASQDIEVVAAAPTAVVVVPLQKKKKAKACAATAPTEHTTTLEHHTTPASKPAVSSSPTVSSTAAVPGKKKKSKSSAAPTVNQSELAPNANATAEATTTATPGAKQKKKKSSSGPEAAAGGATASAVPGSKVAAGGAASTGPAAGKGKKSKKGGPGGPGAGQTQVQQPVLVVPVPPVKFRAFHWKPLNAAAAADQNTLWHHVVKDLVHQQDTGASCPGAKCCAPLLSGSDCLIVDECFGLAAEKDKTAAGSGQDKSGGQCKAGDGAGADNKASKRASVLDAKKCQALLIMLATLPPVTQVVAAIAELNDSVLEQDDVSAILRHMPTPAETLAIDKAVQDAGGDASSLDKADAFCRVLSADPDMHLRLFFWSFRMEYKEMYRAALDGTAKLSVVCEQMADSKKLQASLALILQVGNYLNHGPRGNTALGFHLSCLPKATDLKCTSTTTRFKGGASSAKGGACLVDVVAHIMHGKPTLGGAIDLPALSDACKVDITEVSGEVNKLFKGIKELRHKSEARIKQFEVEKAARKADRLAARQATREAAAAVAAAAAAAASPPRAQQSAAAPAAAITEPRTGSDQSMMLLMAGGSLDESFSEEMLLADGAEKEEQKKEEQKKEEEEEEEEDGIAAPEICTVMAAFVASSENALAGLKSNFDDASANFTKLLVFYGYQQRELSRMKSTEFFPLVREFITRYNASSSDIAAKAEALAIEEGKQSVYKGVERNTAAATPGKGGGENEDPALALQRSSSVKAAAAAAADTLKVSQKQAMHDTRERTAAMSVRRQPSKR